jgi:hypothetical protein
MITLQKNTNEEFEGEFKDRRKKLRSIAMKGLLDILYSNALSGVNVEASDLSRALDIDTRKLHKSISNMRLSHGIKVINETGKNYKSSYRLVGFFTPRKRKCKPRKKDVVPQFIYEPTVNDKILNQVFC